MTAADNIARANKAAEEAEKAAMKAKATAEKAQKEAEAQAKKEAEIIQKQQESEVRRRAAAKVAATPSTGDGDNLRRDKGDWSML